MRRYLRVVPIAALSLLINAPIILVVLNSFQTTDEMLAGHSLIPARFHLENYRFLLGRTPYLGFFLNSGLVATVSTVLTLIAAALAGYTLSRFKGRALSLYGAMLLMVQMFPIIMAIIPLFIIFRTLGMINSPASVIIIYTAVHLPFATWMFRAFFDSIPRELDEAALVDGCTRVSALLRIILPLTGPGLAAVAIFSFLFSYNEFFIASVFLRDDVVMTVPVGVQMFMQQYATDWGSLMAAATMTMLPTFVFLMFVQKHMTSGAVEGGVKG
jgi:ABC-type glycerol-3-phosphate transport system permease component